MRALALLLAAPAVAQEEAPRAPDELERIAAEGTVEERLHLAVWLLRESERRVLAPTAAQRDQVAALLRRSDTGITCMAKGDALAPWTLVEDAGSYFCFEHESHARSWDECDLRLHWGFGADFRGGRIGMIAPLGDVDLLELPTEREPVPALLDRELQDTWLTFWEPLTEEDVERGSVFRQNVVRYLEPQIPNADTTYLLRLGQPGGANRLVAFRVLGENDHGAVTLAWRVLHRWERSSLIRPADPGRWDEVPPAPEWLWERYDQVDQATIAGWITVLRERSRPVLFEVPEALRGRYEQLISSQVETFGERHGFARILRRFRYLPLVGEEGAGTYYSFRRGEITWQHGQIGLSENGHLWGPFAGNLLLDLGDLTFADLRGVIAGGPPPDIGGDEHASSAWEVLWSPLRAPGGGITPELQATLERLGLSTSSPANLGHSYLWRNTQSRESDELVLMTLLAVDEVGVSFAWRVLRSFPVR